VKQGARENRGGKDACNCQMQSAGKQCFYDAATTQKPSSAQVVRKLRLMENGGKGGGVRANSEASDNLETQPTFFIFISILL
jgi:hypothetical protein